MTNNVSVHTEVVNLLALLLLLSSPQYPHCPCLCVYLSVLRWRELSGMKEARKNHGLVVVNSRIYAVGGQGALGTNKC